IWHSEIVLRGTLLFLKVVRFSYTTRKRGRDVSAPGPLAMEELAPMRDQATSADRLRDIHEQLQQGVHALTTSDDWQRALSFAARFHAYSFGNALLIHRQRPEATLVAGF